MSLILAAPAFFVASLRLSQLDALIAEWFRARLGGSPAPSIYADFLLGLSGPASALWVTPVLICVMAYLAWKRHWYVLLTLFLTVPCGALLGEGLKLLIRRPRPFVGGPFGEWLGYSFPSGHTLTATLLYGCLAVLLIPLLPRKRWGTLGIALSTALILGVALSRVALGAHYVTDVVAGMVLGMGWVSLCSLAVAQVRRHRARELPLNVAPDTVAVSPSN